MTSLLCHHQQPFPPLHLPYIATSPSILHHISFASLHPLPESLHSVEYIDQIVVFVRDILISGLLRGGYEKRRIERGLACEVRRWKGWRGLLGGSVGMCL